MILIHSLLRGVKAMFYMPLLWAVGCEGTHFEIPQAAAEKHVQLQTEFQTSKCGAEENFVHAVLVRAGIDQRTETVTIEEHAEDGILALHIRESCFAVAPSWHLFEFETASWARLGEANEIIVIASFATGMGPGGAHPFRIQITMSETGGVWTPSQTASLSHDTGAKMAAKDPRQPSQYQSKPKWSDDRPNMEVAKSTEELKLLSESRSASLADVGVDFERERLILATVMLTSGSMKLVNVRVQKHKDGYDVTYDVQTPRIGTADIKRSGIFVVLPADERQVRVFERGRGETPIGERVHVQSGVIAQLSG